MSTLAGRSRWWVTLVVLATPLTVASAACRERPSEPTRFGSRATAVQPSVRAPTPARSSRPPAPAATVEGSARPSAQGAITAARSARPSSEGTVEPPPAARSPGVPFRYPAADRVVAVGDLHGDLEATRAALRLVGATDSRDRWVAGKLVLVQTGDQLDRGDDEREILELLRRLSQEAAQTGGAVHVLNGNHEIMNVDGDFRYVTDGGFAAFADVTAESRVAQLASGFPQKMRGRARAFLPGGPYARRLGQRNTVVIVGRTVFAHGGVLPANVEYGLERINERARRWMNGTSLHPPPELTDEDSPVWTRRYADGKLSGQLCAEVGRVLEMLDVDRMVVGHTVQKSGITSACDERVWRIDVGLSRYYGGPVAGLEIKQGQVRALTAPR